MKKEFKIKMTNEKLVKREVYSSKFYGGTDVIYIGEVFWKDPAVLLRNPENDKLEIYRFEEYSLDERNLSPKEPFLIKNPHRLIMNKLERIAEEEGI